MERDGEVFQRHRSALILNLQHKFMPIKSKLVSVGSPAPDFTIPVASGGQFTLSQHQGTSCVVLVFLRSFR